jgi:hypothetical protein
MSCLYSSVRITVCHIKLSYAIRFISSHIFMSLTDKNKPVANKIPSASSARLSWCDNFKLFVHDGIKWMNSDSAMYILLPTLSNCGKWAKIILPIQLLGSNLKLFVYFPFTTWLYWRLANICSIFYLLPCNPGSGRRVGRSLPRREQSSSSSHSPWQDRRVSNHGRLINLIYIYFKFSLFFSDGLRI